MPNKWYQTMVRGCKFLVCSVVLFGLWKVQVKDVLIQSGLHKMRKVWPYNEILSRWSKFGKRLRVSASLVERYILLLCDGGVMSMAELLPRKANMESNTIKSQQGLFDMCRRNS
ncbi:hypothetical protein PIB30_056060 [Stylosanthes scabra]|uniref:Uncharacterized protein n=1 Tax=Stylosanthes scabra TaxID=79078 RepID=A0ABU6ZHX9_9FABA|nr:hypothetical protein [Stylosanthes scabra]